METQSKALVRIQQVSVLYLVIWTVSPFMEIDMIWRIGAFAAFGLWLICAISRGLHLERIHLLALGFVVLVVIVNIIENNGFSKILRDGAVLYHGSFLPGQMERVIFHCSYYTYLFDLF